jgi:hypothetical protein
MSAKNLKHGHCRRNEPRSRVYKIWASMIRRCHTKSASGYYKYGAKGIEVCQEWRSSFEAFLADMGEPQDGYSIDRIDNKKGYFKDNCRWATIYEQAANKQRNLRFTINGNTNCLAEWCRIYKSNYQLALSRVKRNWDIEKALTTPPRSLKQNGK